MKTKPDLSFWKLWNISFGFFGVQIAYALQSANISRIFSTLGADPHDLSYFWILPPLAGIIVQPLVGAASDRTWTRFGRRIPYLFVGALVAVIVMCLLPNSGSFGMEVSTAMIFGLISLMLLDTSINMAMQPFKMMVGDMVNERQKGLAYSIQSFLCNAGSLVGYLFPFFFAWFGIRNTAPQGVIPPSVIWAFYVGAAILILCVIYTTVKVKEMPPREYAEYHGIVQKHVYERHDYGIHGQDFRVGDAYVKGAEHDIDERKQQSPHAPDEKFVGGIVHAFRVDEQAYHRFGKHEHQHEHYHCHRETECAALPHDFAYHVVVALSVSPCYEYLRTYAEAECHCVDADVEQSAHGCSSERGFSHMSEKCGVGHIDYVLGEQTEKNGVGYVPDVSVVECLLHVFFLFSPAKILFFIDMSLSVAFAGAETRAFFCCRCLFYLVILHRWKK